MAGGRRSKPAPPPPPQKTLVVDNGASTIKAGFVTASDDPTTLEPRIIPNCIARDRFKKIYVADELEKCKDFSDIQYRRPADRGYIVNWEAQREIWNRQFFDDKAPLRCDPADTRLLLCEPPNNLPVLQTNCDQIVFEEYGFASYYRAVGTLRPAILNPRRPRLTRCQARRSMPIMTCSHSSEPQKTTTSPPRSRPR